MSRQSWRAGSACFIARLSSSVENVDRRKDVEQPSAKTLSTVTPAHGAVQADVDALRHVSATTDLNDPTTGK